MPETLFCCRRCDNVIGHASLVQPFRQHMSAMPAEDLEKKNMDESTHWAIALNHYTTSKCIITPHNKYDKGGKIRRIAKVWCDRCNLNLGNLQEADNSRTTAELDLDVQSDVYHFLKIANVKYRTTLGHSFVTRPIDCYKDMELKCMNESGLFNEQFHNAFVMWHDLYYIKRSTGRRARRACITLRSYLDARGLSLVPLAAEFPGNVVVETIEYPATSEVPIEAADPKDTKDTETEQPDEQPDDAASEASAYTLPSTDDGAKADLERQLAGLRAASQADAKTDVLRQLEDLRVAVDRLTTTTVAILARA